MPNLYCVVENGQVVDGPRSVPEQWVGAPGIVNFHKLTDAQLLTYGWYPYILDDIGAPDEYYDRGLSDFDIQATQVVQAAVYTSWTIERVKEDKTGELRGHIPSYLGSEISADTDKDFEVKDISEWSKNRIVTLGNVTDLTAAKNFDTSLPDLIPLPNSYLGARQASQGEQVFLEESVRNDVAATAFSDPEVKAWQLQNYQAKDDVTNATGVIDAPAIIRQNVNQANEYSGVVEVRRFEWTDQDSWPGHGIIATLRRSDVRDVLFTWYDEAGVYQYWKQFVETSDGVWQVETDPGQRWSNPETFQFTLNYNTVTEFTNRTTMPSTVVELVSKVRYNR